MMINSSKVSVLAKLMANENIIVLHDSTAHTASFDVKSRTLTLPLLKYMNGYYYDSFVAHEVSHALYTPVSIHEDMEKNYKDLPFSYVNVIEDVRIERKIKEKFPGTKIDFYHFYKDVTENENVDLFKLNETSQKDIDEFYLIDKINLQYKIGDYLYLRKLKINYLNETEKTLMDKCRNVSTFSEVLELANEIRIYDKKRENEKQFKNTGNTGNNNNNNNNNDNTENDDSQHRAGHTQETFENNRSEELIKHFNGDGNSSSFYIDGIHLDTIKEGVEGDSFKSLASYLKENDVQEYNDFINDTKSIVQQMVNRFNMKKQAKEYQNRREHNTGVINTSKLSEYKTNDNIFLNMESIPEGTNHGIIFLLDLSGSMMAEIGITIKHLILLMKFCMQVGIHFEVYSFTGNSFLSSFSEHEDYKPHDFIVCRKQSYINKMVSSSYTKKEINDILMSLYCAFSGLTSDYIYHYQHDSNIMLFGSTPISTSLYGIDLVIKKFKQKFNNEKVNFILMSDGSSTDMIDYDNKDVYVQNPHTRKNYLIKNDSSFHSYHYYMKYLRDKHGLNSAVGYYLTSAYNKKILENLTVGTKENIYDSKYSIREFNSKGYLFAPPSVGFDNYFIVDVGKFKFKKDSLSAQSRKMIFLNGIIDKIS